MDGSAEDPTAPDSWEVADLDESMRKLMVSSKRNTSLSTVLPSKEEFEDDLTSATALPSASASSLFLSPASQNRGVSDDILNQVDQFLIEALNNPRERLSILRMEQDVEKFIRDPKQQYLEFQQLPTSYLRLAAHRIAQHYSLQSIAMPDNNLPDGSGSRIVLQKNSDIRFPSVRLADIPISLPSDDSRCLVKVAIKRRPQKRSLLTSNAHVQSSKLNLAKSVEERKEEYNKARARIFSNSSSNSTESMSEDGLVSHENLQRFSVQGKVDEKVVEGTERGHCQGSGDISNNWINKSRTEDPDSRHKANNRVAIFRDLEGDRKDPDYDRNYERYMQRFDPGFGFSGGSYTIQPMYSPAFNYNTEFPQLGSAPRPHHLPIDPQSQHLRSPWVAPSAHSPVGYGAHDNVVTPFSPNHVGGHSSSIYLHSSQYACPHPPGLQFIHPQDNVHQPFIQSHLQQSEATFGIARPR